MKFSDFLPRIIIDDFPKTFKLMELEQDDEGVISIVGNMYDIDEYTFDKNKIHQTKINNYIENWIYGNSNFDSIKNDIQLSDLLSIIRRNSSLIASQTRRGAGNNIIFNKNICDKFLNHTETILKFLKSDSYFGLSNISEHISNINDNKIIVYYSNILVNNFIDSGILLVKKDEYVMPIFNKNAKDYFRFIQLN